MSADAQSIDLPALLGGTPLWPKGPPVWPCADPDIFDVLHQAYQTGTWGKYHGDHCQALDTWLREFHSINHVLLCGSGNYAVELALRALKIGPGDEVILADYDYPGNFLSIHAVGALPVLVGLEARNWNLSLDAVRAAIGPKTKAILASHLHGGRIPMPELMELAREKGLRVIEDAAQASGALIAGRRAGSWGDAGVLSFGGSKLLSAGRGGALLTPHADVAQRARNHLVREGNLVCPLTELQAALLLPQCRKLEERNAIRWRNVQTLAAALDAPGVRLFVDADEPVLPAFYKLGIQFDEASFGLRREVAVQALRAEGFAVDVGFEGAARRRAPSRYRLGPIVEQTQQAATGCVMLHHPILLEEGDAMLAFAAAWRRVYELRDRFGP